MQKRAILLIGLVAVLGRFAASQVAANTDFTVQLSPPGINTKTAAENDEIHTIVLRPEAFASYELVGRIVKAHKSGKLKGSTMVAFRFERLEKAGQVVPVNGTLKQVTNSKGAPNVDEEGHAIRTKNNYGKVVGTAAIGALIGGLSGGGKGALVGAGAGTAAAILFVEVAASDGADFELAPNSVLLITVSPRNGETVREPAASPAIPANPALSPNASTPEAHSFRVRHDHGSRGNYPAAWRYCEGVLYVFPDRVYFKASASTDGHTDSFELPFAEVQEVKANFIMIMHTSAFHLRFKTGTTLNFVPIGSTPAEVLSSFPSPPRN